MTLKKEPTEILAAFLVGMPVIIVLLGYILLGEFGMLAGFILGGIWFYYWSWK